MISVPNWLWSRIRGRNVPGSSPGATEDPPCGAGMGIKSIVIDWCSLLQHPWVAAVAEWYRYRTVACFVTGSSPVPLKTRRVGQRCTLNLSRAETSSRWCGVVVRREGASSGVVHVT
ncbi:uncharacterized protein TNCV_1622541 [Trichonephila clavipes]|nr:uncharacterized protein TNCV_1622541 [Trichonephila clavipes]